MFMRNIFFLSLLTAYYPNSYCTEESTTMALTPISSEADLNDAESLFGEDDAFADVKIDLTCKPKKLPLWKRAGAWVFMKCYWPMKRVILWWQKDSRKKSAAAKKHAQAKR